MKQDEVDLKKTNPQKTNPDFQKEETRPRHPSDRTPTRPLAPVKSSQHRRRKTGRSFRRRVFNPLVAVAVLPMVWTLPSLALARPGSQKETLSNSKKAQTRRVKRKTRRRSRVQRRRVPGSTDGAKRSRLFSRRRHRGAVPSRRRRRKRPHRHRIRRPSPLPGVLQAITRALSDPNPKVRREAVFALSSFGPHALPALKKAARSKHVEVRRQAIIALGRIASRSRRRRRSPPGHTKGNRGAPFFKEALKILGSALQDKKAKVRREAVYSLARLGPMATPVLLKALRSSKDPRVRRQVIIALSRLNRRHRRRHRRSHGARSQGSRHSRYHSRRHEAKLIVGAKLSDAVRTGD